MSPKSAVFVLLAVALFLVALSSSVFDPSKVLAVTNNQVTGYAYSSTIGWIKFNHTKTNNVTLNDSKQFVGFGWSPNVGWVKFDPSLRGPDGTGVAAKVDTSVTPNTIVGWARVCSGMVSTGDLTTNPNNNCSGSGRTDGFDGWIHFDHNKVNYQIKADSKGKLSGFAWGAEVVGWMGMSRVQIPAGDITLTVNKTGDGTVTSAGGSGSIDCGSTCISTYTQDDDVTLTADDTSTSWDGCDSKPDAKICKVKMTDSKIVTVVFPTSGCNDPNGCNNGGLTVTCLANGVGGSSYTTTKDTPVSWAANASGGSNYTYSWTGSASGSGDSYALNTATLGSYNAAVQVTSGTNVASANCPTVIVTDVPAGEIPHISVAGLTVTKEILIDCEHNLNCANPANIRSQLLTVTNTGEIPVDLNLVISGFDDASVDTAQSLTNIPARGGKVTFRIKVSPRHPGEELFGSLGITASESGNPTNSRDPISIKIHYLDGTVSPK